jgi:hypothetical protein
MADFLYGNFGKDLKTPKGDVVPVCHHAVRHIQTVVA